MVVVFNTATALRWLTDWRVDYPAAGRARVGSRLRYLHEDSSAGARSARTLPCQSAWRVRTQLLWTRQPPLPLLPDLGRIPPGPNRYRTPGCPAPDEDPCPAGSGCAWARSAENSGAVPRRERR